MLRFLREGEDDSTEPTTWDDKLALKYYDSLYREFAVCDLKHYKSGNVRFIHPFIHCLRSVLDTPAVLALLNNV